MSNATPTPYNVQTTIIGTPPSSTQVFDDIFMPRDPTANDINYNIQQKWLNTNTGYYYILTAFYLSANVTQATWVLISGGSSSLSILNGDTGSATPTAGAITISGGSTGLTTAASASTVNLTGVLNPVNGGTGISSYTIGDILYASATNVLSKLPIGSSNEVLTVTGGIPAWAPSSVPSTFPWTNKTTSFAAAAANGYFITNTATATLPASPSRGDTIEFIVDTTAILTIQAVGSQTIRIANSLSSAAGTAVNSLQGDSLTLIYSDTTTCWVALDLNGNWQLN